MLATTIHFRSGESLVSIVPVSGIAVMLLVLLRMRRDLKEKGQFQIDPGFPDWKGNILKHLSATELNLARMDMEENRIPRPEFLLRVRKAMLLVQEGVRCRSTVKIDRTSSTKMSQVKSFA